MYNLQVRYDARNSFGGKAKVDEKDGKITLISYTTEVCVIENGKARVIGFFSKTTTRHIREFLKQNGFKAESVQQIKRDYQEA